jgi:molecular chaperone GrpE
MSRRPSDKPTPPPPAEDESMDDIEILEVVGLDEDGAPLPDDEPPSDDVEVVFEDASDEAAAVADRAPAAPADLSNETRELRERMVRLQADFENFKKRMDRERLDHLRHATSELLGRLLPVLDNFERAIVAARPGGPADPVIEGVGLIHRQLLQELEREGLRGMESVGQPFNPVLHEAVATDDDPSVSPQTVTHVFQRGYFLHDRLLRPAMVRVRVDDQDGQAAADDRKESLDG